MHIEQNKTSSLWENCRKKETQGNSGDKKHVICPDCKKVFLVLPELLGKINECPFCSCYFIVPPIEIYVPRSLKTPEDIVPRCGKCMRHGVQMREYAFYCAQIAGSRTTDEGAGLSVRTTKYVIVRIPVYIPICDRCISKRRMLYLFGALGIILAVLIVTLWGIVAGNAIGFLCPMSFIFLGIVMFPIWLLKEAFKMRLDVGDEIAIEVCEKKMRARPYIKGYNKFFTQKQYFKAIAGLGDFDR
ncbi:hypothetical protein JW935_23150 [candidate division KSB1 bacterium]|nr:hypothetical protein [candidate division KSB1 bacterium]